MNSTLHICVDGNNSVIAGEHRFQLISTGLENSYWNQEMNAKDSLRAKSLGIPSILLEQIVQHQNNSRCHKGTRSHGTSNGKRRNKSQVGDAGMDSRKAQRSPKIVSSDKTDYWLDDSFIAAIPTINNMYYQEVTDDDCDGDTCRYKSAPRPIRRTQQEKDVMYQEEKIISAAAHEYDMATWRMYDRIMKHRQKRPLPDRYYDEVNKVVPALHESTKTELLNSETMPSDWTATTIGTNSTSSSPSLLCESPKFTAIPHSKSRSRSTHMCVDCTDDNIQSRGTGIPQSVESNVLTTGNGDNEQSLFITTNDEEESDNEYTDMMMFDLEL